MAPKKGQKMSLNAFLEEQSLGSWADEMDSLPTAPAQKTDEERARMNERGSFAGKDRDFAARPDRNFPAREELPIPTEPPFTVFVGNLSFDLVEEELGEFFAPSATRSVKIIKDRDDKPKGFGYVEFEELEGLKDALNKTGTTFQNRQIRVSVAAPPSQRQGFDDEKFSGPWRREGPLPDRQGSRFGGDDRVSRGPREDRGPSLAEANTDWRSNRPPPVVSRFDDAPRPVRSRSGFSTPTGEPSAADTTEEWTRGSKFAPTPPDSATRGRFGSIRSDRGEGPGATPLRREPSVSESTGDWRSAMRATRTTSTDKSPSSSTPPTPQIGRRKLELMPRSTSGGNSTVSSPLSSPKLAHAIVNKPNPFGAAKPVDVSARETEVEERLKKEREELAKTAAERSPMARTSSKPAIERKSSTAATSDAGATSPTTSSPGQLSKEGVASSSTTKAPSSVVRPAFSFASAAGGKKTEPEAAVPSTQTTAEAGDSTLQAISETAEKVAEISV